MFTAIYSLDKVVGAEIMLAGWILCAVVYVVVCGLFRANRTKSGMRIVLLALLGAEVVADALCAFVYYDSGNYVNCGIGGTYGLLLWPLALLILGPLVTKHNKDQ